LKAGLLDWSKHKLKINLEKKEKINIYT